MRKFDEYTALHLSYLTYNKMWVLIALNCENLVKICTNYHSFLRYFFRHMAVFSTYQKQLWKSQKISNFGVKNNNSDKKINNIASLLISRRKKYIFQTWAIIVSMKIYFPWQEFFSQTFFSQFVHKIMLIINYSKSAEI